jgi:peptidoglycan/xylan/chitin deacetylase (PgdA/CDA1 family)
MHRFAVPDLAVNGHDPAALSKHLEYLRRRRYRLMSLQDLLDHLDKGIPLAENALIFTVDDGYADFASVGAPVFEAYDCPVTVFLVTDFVSGRLWNWFDHVEWAFIHTDKHEMTLEISGEKIRLRWTNVADRVRVADEFVERLKRGKDGLKDELIGRLEEILEVNIPELAPEEYKAMSWDQVRSCASRGATFGPHTVSHPILSQVEANRSDYEISESWRAVADATGAAVPVFCYPNGTLSDFSSREKASIARAGMAAALSTIEASLESSPSGIFAPDRFALPRFAYPEETQRFVQMASGLEARKARIRRRLA